MPTRISEDTHAHIARVWPDLLARIAAGDLIKDILKELELSSGMIRAYLARSPASVRKDWEDAREESADSYFNEALDIARTHQVIVRKDSNGELLPEPLILAVEPAHARTHIDTLKWASRIRNPRLYGDKSQVDLNVRTVDLTRIISDANARLEASKALGRVIEGEVIRQALPAALDDLL